MDREIPKETRIKERRMLCLKIGAGIIIVAGFAISLSFLLDSSVKEKELTLAKAELATLESSVTASGKIVPLYEQAIVSPVATQILEVFCDEGDSVTAGQSLLLLDLQNAETDMRRLSDEVSMREIEMEQTALNNETYITDLEMKIKAKEMSVSHLKAEVSNEKRLDSIGSGTGDKIREAELAYSTGILELEQMQTQLKNEKKAREATYKSKQLETSISRRNLLSMQRTLDEAKIKAPRNGTVTYLNKELGTSISAGEKLAVVSDLSHFKIQGEIAEGNAGRLSVGSSVNVRFNRNIVSGHISNIAPQSHNGIIEFNVILEDDNDKRLRSGLRVDLNVVYDVHENVVRIPNGQYFQGPGNYSLFVKTEPDRLEKRTVTLGDSNFDFVEVISGLLPGDEVVISDMTNYLTKKSLTLK